MTKKPYEPIEELKRIKNYCSKATPQLKSHHWKVLEILEIKNENAINQNVTSFFVSEIKKYNEEVKVFRCGHTGETRGGKSEGSQTTALIDQYFFNKLLAQGHFDQVDVDLKKEPVDLCVERIHRNETYYLDYVRKSFENKTLVYGESNIVDEKEKSTGGLGTMTQYIEQENMNNIIAKYNIKEQRLYPRGFVDMNAAYGIHWFIKDIKNKVNWGLLYKLGARTAGITGETFLGWVCLPLHQNHELRKKYEKKKNDWINQIIEGGGDPRVKMRQEASIKVSENKLFSRMKTEKSFVLTNDQQLDVIDDMVAKGELHAFNQEERKRIMSRAQLIVKMRNYPELYGNVEELIGE